MISCEYRDSIEIACSYEIDGGRVVKSDENVSGEAKIPPRMTLKREL